MTNKEYKDAKYDAENADELYTYEKYNGWYVSRYMNGDELKQLRHEYKDDAATYNVVKRCDRMEIIKGLENCYILKSYQTIVAAYYNGQFYRIWNGYSVTTHKHINTFCTFLNIPQYSKRELIELVTVNDVISITTGEILADNTGYIAR